MPGLIVCLTGMPGAGKSTIAEGLRARGLPVVVMGDAVRAEAARRGLEPTRGSLAGLMRGLRERDGPAAVARLVAPAVSAEPGAVVVDGVRSEDEVRLFRGLGRVRILCVHASADRRFGLLGARGRRDDPADRGRFDDRDAGEIRVGLSGPIAMADESLSNNGLTAEQLVEEAHRIVRGWGA